MSLDIELIKDGEVKKVYTCDICEKRFTWKQGESGEYSSLLYTEYYGNDARLWICSVPCHELSKGALAKLYTKKLVKLGFDKKPRVDGSW